MNDVKSSVAEELLREHEVVREITQKIEMLVEEGGTLGHEPDWAWRLSGELSAFRSHLKRHFELEEDGGFLPDVLNLEPQSAGQVQRLRDEHTEILEGVDEVIHDSNLLAYGTSLELDKFQQRVSQLVSLIRNHENEENGLIQKVYYHEMTAID